MNLRNYFAFKIDSITKGNVPVIFLNNKTFSDQELFDLLVLHIEDSSQRPNLPFNSIYYGYGSKKVNWSQKTTTRRKLANENTMIHQLAFEGIRLTQILKQSVKVESLWNTST